jgi:Fusaric acid resistance protein-like
MRRWILETRGTVSKLGFGSIRKLGLVSVFLVPSTLLACATGDPRWMRSAFVAVCSFVAADRGELDLPATVVQGLAMQAGWILLCASLAHGTWLVPVLMLVGGLGTFFGAHDERRRAAVCFTVVPAIYLAFDLAGEVTANGGRAIVDGLLVFLVGGIPTWLWQLGKHLASDSARSPSTPVGRGTARDGATRCAPNALASSVGAAAGMGLCGWLSLRLAIPHAHWLVWSSFVVIDGDVGSTARKLRGRAVGALVGVPFGAAAAHFLPCSSGAATLAMFSAFATLTAPRPYAIFYGIRSALVALSIVASGGDDLVPLARIVEVLCGGGIGLAAVFISHFVLIPILRHLPSMACFGARLRRRCR